MSLYSASPSTASPAGADGAFDVRDFARTARGSHRAELDLETLGQASLGEEAVRLIRILRDLERATMQRMRNLLVTATHKDARVTAFLTTWAYEKFWLADALDAVLDATGHERSAPDAEGPLRRSPAERAERRGPVRRAIAGNLAGPQLVAAHVTTGLVDEWVMQAAFRRLGELASALESVAELAVEIKDRHIRFFAEEASRRLGASRRARQLARKEIARSAWPIGAVERPAADRSFFETVVFGSAPGRAAAERISELLAALPGLTNVAPTVAARLVP